MLVSFRQHYPFRLDASETRSTALETNLPVSPVIQPKIFFRNVAAAAVQVTLTHTFDLGISDDPLLTGAFSTIMFSEEVTSGQLLWHEFAATHLGSGLVHHSFSIENLDSAQEATIHCWVEGLYEESLGVPPQFEPIVL